MTDNNYHVKNGYMQYDSPKEDDDSIGLIGDDKVIHVHQNDGAECTYDSDEDTYFDREGNECVDPIHTSGPINIAAYPREQQWPPPGYFGAMADPAFPEPEEDELAELARTVFNKARWETLKGNPFSLDVLDVYGPMVEEVEWVDVPDLIDRMRPKHTCDWGCGNPAVVELGYAPRIGQPARLILCTYHSITEAVSARTYGYAPTVVSLTTGRML